MAFFTLFVLALTFLSHSLAAPTAHLSFIQPQAASWLTPESRAISSTPTLHEVTRKGAETTYCRQMHTPPSKCVDPPAFTHEGVEFCPYHMCAPKYVEAELCPANHHLAAKAKCYEELITRVVYKCDHKYEKKKTVPENCTVGEGNCKEEHFCSCYKASRVGTKQLKFIATFEPYCGPVH